MHNLKGRSMVVQPCREMCAIANMISLFNNSMDV